VHVSSVCVCTYNPHTPAQLWFFDWLVFGSREFGLVRARLGEGDRQ